ncbi:MAG: regulatory protein RecX [Pseudomonadales bacterium]|nr:regulatory protein RecX [Pseudomonadales bacterium]
MPADDQPILKNCRRVMMNMMARREHSACELKRKAKEKLLVQIKKHSPCIAIDYHALEDVIDDALLLLQADGLQDDARYTEIYIRNRAALLYGPERIRAELHQKGIEHSLIDSQMQDSAVDWAWSLQLALDKKLCADPGTLDYTERQKLMAYLARRGFDEHDIRQICQHGLND